MSEARRGLARIASNYVRLALTLVIGLLVVRLLLQTLGNDAYGLIALLGASVGFGTIVETIVRQCLIRELGEAYHRRDSLVFRRTLSTAAALCLAGAFVAVGVFLLLLLVLPLLAIPPELQWAARWFVVVNGVQGFFTVLLAPQFNMYMVTERMVAYNAWVTVKRGARLVAAALLLFVGVQDVGMGIVVFGAVYALGVTALLIVSVVWICAIEPGLLPAAKLVNRESARSLLTLGGWNVGILTASNLHDRTDALIMNLAFGVTGNLIFGLAFQLISYVRMLATGMTAGVDAVAARISSSGKSQDLSRLLYHSTRLHGLVTFPAMLLVVVLAEPLLLVWVGQRVEDPQTTLPPTVILVWILAVGIGVRSIGDGWVRVLYGAGHIRRYAPVVLAAGVANPVLAVGLLWILPESIRFTAPSLAYSGAFTVLHGLAIPLIAARLLQMSAREMYMPLLRPLIVTLLATPVLLLTVWWIEHWNLFTLAVTGLLFGGTYALLALMGVITPAERQRLRLMLARRSKQKPSKAVT